LAAAGSYRAGVTHGAAGARVVYSKRPRLVQARMSTT
jgi:hypothetical protein